MWWFICRYCKYTNGISLFWKVRGQLWKRYSNDCAPNLKNSKSCVIKDVQYYIEYYFLSLLHLQYRIIMADDTYNDCISDLFTVCVYDMDSSQPIFEKDSISRDKIHSTVFIPWSHNCDNTLPWQKEARLYIMTVKQVSIAGVWANFVCVIESKYHLKSETYFGLCAQWKSELWWMNYGWIHYLWKSLKMSI